MLTFKMSASQYFGNISAQILPNNKKQDIFEINAKMSKMKFRDPKEAEKFKKQKWKQFWWTPCRCVRTKYEDILISNEHKDIFGKIKFE